MESIFSQLEITGVDIAGVEGLAEFLKERMNASRPVITEAMMPAILSKNNPKAYAMAILRKEMERNYKVHYTIKVPDKRAKLPHHSHRSSVSLVLSRVIFFLKEVLNFDKNDPRWGTVVYTVVKNGGTNYLDQLVNECGYDHDKDQGDHVRTEEVIMKVKNRLLREMNMPEEWTYDKVVTVDKDDNVMDDLVKEVEKEIEKINNEGV